jgi:DNA processing protein
MNTTPVYTPEFDTTDRRLAAITWGYLTTDGGDHGNQDAHRYIATRHDGDPASALTEFCHMGATTKGLPTETARLWGARLEGFNPNRVLDATYNLGGVVLTRDDPEWPEDAFYGFRPDMATGEPFALYVKTPFGLCDLNQRLESAITVVGARASTAYGEHVTADLAGTWAGDGHTIVSGGAYGIDAAAHRAALAAGGYTIACMAGGLDRLYPPGNERLLDEVAHRGAIITEAVPGTLPTRSGFLARNRIMAAFGQATIVTEAGLRSGARNTAQWAEQLYRPVGAVPGPITSAMSAGPNQMIREGHAHAICQPADVYQMGEREGHMEGVDHPGPWVDTSLTGPAPTRPVAELALA